MGLFDTVANISTGGLYGVGKKIAKKGLASKDSSTQETNVTRPATPMRVKLPSGATVTMYAYGPESQKTTGTASHDPGLLEIGGMLAQGAGLAGKYGGGSAAGARSAAPATAGFLAPQAPAGPALDYRDPDWFQQLING